MRVVKTPVKKRPSNRASRAIRARSHARQSRSRPLLTVVRSLARSWSTGAPGGRPRPETARRLTPNPIACSPDMSARYFHGWNVVVATFIMALFSFGLGFYGLSVYVATFQRLLGWSASSVSAPVTVYYIAGALLTTVMGDLYERFGPRAVVAVGSVAMAAGLAALGQVTRPWQLYPAFLLMSVGWGAMSGAAINIILAPWFERRRGLAVSIAFNGATLGGVCIAPALIALIGAVGFTRALALAAVVLLVVLVAVAACVMGRGPEGRGLGPDGDSQRVVRADPSQGGVPGRRGDALRTWRFWSVSAPFALGLAAQVGVLTHMVALVTPRLGAGGAARAVSATTAAALVGRLATGFVVD